MKNELNMKKSDIGKMQNRDNVPATDASSALNFSIEVAKINKGKVKTPQELEERFTKLFEISSKMGKVPRYEHLILVSGFPRSTFYDYRK